MLEIFLFKIIIFHPFLKAIKNAEFEKIAQIITEYDENKKDGLLKLKINDAKEVFF